MLDRRQRITVACLVGITEAGTKMRRLDRTEALDEMTAALASYIPEVQAAILAHAAAAFVDGHAHHDQAATELLAAAGADIEQARRIRAEREAKGSPLTAIADQANRERDGRLPTLSRIDDRRGPIG